MSGRLSGFPEIVDELTTRLARFGKVRLVRRQAQTAKAAAEGAFVIGDGLLGGRYAPVVEALQLRKASGTMFDHILIKGAVPARP